MTWVQFLSSKIGNWIFAVELLFLFYIILLELQLYTKLLTCIENIPTNVLNSNTVINKYLPLCCKKLSVLFLPGKNWLNLQMPIEGLIEKEASLEGWYDGEPSQNSYGRKKNDPHSIVVRFSKNLYEVP